MLRQYSATVLTARPLQLTPHFIAYGSVLAEVGKLNPPRCVTAIYPEAIKIYANVFEVDKSAKSELITAVLLKNHVIRDFMLCNWVNSCQCLRNVWN